MNEELARRLREDAQHLDAATLARLNRARQRALDEFDRQRQRPRWLAGMPGWQPAAGAVAVTVLALAFWVGREVRVPAPAEDPRGDVVAQDPASPGAMDVSVAADVDLVLDGENIEMLEEIEFFAWLDEAPAAGAPASADGLSG